MGACRIHCFLLLSLLGFFPCSGTLTCHKGIMVKFGSGFTETAMEWKVFGTIKATPYEICQETLLLLDVGNESLILASKGCSKAESKTGQSVEVFSRGPGIVAASYVNFCVTNLCNDANSTRVLLDSLSLADSSDLGTIKCPVCLQFQGSCSQHSTFVFCPKGTNCYLSDTKIEGGGIKAVFSLDGCIPLSVKNLFKSQTSIGVFSALEIAHLNSNSFPPVLVPSILLAWMLGLSALLSLCVQGFVFSAEPISSHS